MERAVHTKTPHNLICRICCGVCAVLRHAVPGSATYSSTLASTAAAAALVLLIKYQSTTTLPALTPLTLIRSALMSRPLPPATKTLACAIKIWNYSTHTV